MNNLKTENVYLIDKDVDQDPNYAEITRKLDSLCHAYNTFMDSNNQFICELNSYLSYANQNNMNLDIYTVNWELVRLVHKLIPIRKNAKENIEKLYELYDVQF